MRALWEALLYLLYGQNITEQDLPGGQGTLQDKFAYVWHKALCFQSS